jgi:SAM-dependent methyltransferase
MTSGATPVPPTCPICGDDRAATLHAGVTDRVFGAAAGSWTLVRCEGCGAARLHPPPSDAALRAAYSGAYYTHEPPSRQPARSGRLRRALHAARNDHLNARLGYDLAPAWRIGRVAGRLVPPLAALAERGVRSLPAEGRVLDVGCGNGQYVAEAAAAGSEAYGIDVDARAVQAGAAAGLELAVETIDARAAREPGFYDAVTLSHVIEHVPDPIAFLRAAHALLRPGGRLWIATPNLASAGHALFGRDWVGLDPPRHLVLFDSPSLLRALSAAGFADVQPVRPVPGAGAAFGVSAAIRGGVARAHDAASAPLRVRGAALLADLRAQLQRSRAEELVVLARRP